MDLAVETLSTDPLYDDIDTAAQEENAERRLLLAIICRAIDDVSPGFLPNSRRNGAWKRKRLKPKLLAIEAREWLIDDSELPFSFVWLCDCLSLDHKFRARIRRLAKESFQFSHQLAFTFF